METKTDSLIIRQAEAADVPLILYFIKELAAYEKLSAEVVATEALLHEWLFEKQVAEALIGELEGKPVGFALFFHNFSTFLGRGGIYLEDIYVLSAYRGRQFGKRLFKRLAQIAIERGCGRMEWSCLNWNQPSIDFYLSLGAQPMDDWTVYRISGEQLVKFGSSAS